MDLYTFFVCKPDGSSTTFEMRELPSDDAVGRHIHAVMAEHACAYVTVWCGDRPVLTRHRQRVGFAAPNQQAVRLN
jgi:hypothetical protein